MVISTQYSTRLVLPNYDTMRAPIAMVMQQQIASSIGFVLLRVTAVSVRSVHLSIIANSIQQISPIHL
jgi:hypothetical protein